MKLEIMPAWAGNENYSTGDKVGTPTKVEPTSGIVADGHLPNRPIGAQWQNWLEYERARRLSALQELAITQWTPATPTAIPQRMARANFCGMTFYTPPTGVSHIYVIFDGQLTDDEIELPDNEVDWKTLDVASNESHASVVVVGRDDALGSYGAAWAAKVGVSSGQFALELESGGSPYDKVRVDEATGDTYVFAPNRAQRSSDGGITWTDLGDHGQSSYDTIAAYDGNVIVLNSTNETYRYSVDSGENWSTGTAPNASAETTTDLRFSTSLGLWIATTYSGSVSRVIGAESVAGPWSTLVQPVPTGGDSHSLCLPHGWALVRDAYMVSSSYAMLQYTLDGVNTRFISLDPASSIRFDGYCLWAVTGSSLHRAALIR